MLKNFKIANAWTGAVAALLLAGIAAFAQSDTLTASAEFRNQLYDGTPTNAPGTSLKQPASVAFASGNIGSGTNLTTPNLVTPNDGQIYLAQSVIGQPFAAPPAALTVPTILVAPASSHVILSSNTVLTVVMGGTPPVTYQWLRNGVPVSGATNASLVIANAQPGLAGSYTVVAGNALGSVTSSPPAVLTVSVPLTITTFAGLAGAAGTNNGPVGVARFSNPQGVAVDTNGNVYVADTGNHTIRKISPNGIVSTLAGLAGSIGNADGIGSTARFSSPQALAMDRAGYLYVADIGNVSIRKISPNGTVSTLPVQIGSYPNGPRGVAVDGSGNVYATDFASSTIHKITPEGVDSVLAGLAGSPGFVDGVGSDARFDYPWCVAVDDAGNVYVTDFGNYTIRKVTPNGTVTTLAGQWLVPGSADGAGSAAQFFAPWGIAVSPDGNLYIADFNNATIRKMTPDGGVVTVAGLAGIGGTADGAGSAARLGNVYGIGVDSAGQVYFCDSGHTIRKGVIGPAIGVQPQGAIVTAGSNVTLNVTAYGTPAVAYQWFRNGLLVAGATNAALAFPNIQLASAGNYTVLVSNTIGSVTSVVATLAIPTLQISQQGSGIVNVNPVQLTYTPGQQVTLTATPARYYTFLRWSDGNTNSPRSITIGASNNLFTAIFTNTIPLEPVVLKQWEQSYGGSAGEFLYSVQKTGDGGYVLGGLSLSGASGNKTSGNSGDYDMWVVKVDASGNKQWDQSYGGSGSDQLISLQQTSDGGYILGGLSNSGISGNKTNASFGDYDYWLVKVDANGTKQWEKEFGGSGDDELNSVQQTADGGYVLGGLSSSGVSGNKTSTNNGSYDYWVVKVDANGNKQWEQSIGGNGYESLNSLQQTGDGGYILGGYSSSIPSGSKTSPRFGIFDFWLVKLDANGGPQWNQSFGGNNVNQLTSIRQVSDGGYILGGMSASDVTGNKTAAWYGSDDYWVIKVDANGSKLWEQSFGGSGVDDLNALCQSGDGGYALGGYSASGATGNKTGTNYGATDYWVVKADANGNKQWEQSFGGNGADYLLDLQRTTDGGLILGGQSSSGVSGNKTSPNYGDSDFWVVKTSNDEQPVGTPVVLVNGLYAISNLFVIPETNSVTVTLQTTFTNGYILYSVDGEPPVFGENAFIYSYQGSIGTPFSVTNTTVLNVVAYSADPDNFEADADPVTIQIVPVYTLTNTTPGGGSVALNPPGGIYLSNTLVTATATASNGWTFMRWAGADTGTNNPLTLPVNSSTNLGAVFGTTISTSVSVAGANVSLWPSTGPYPFGSLVRLVATPPPAPPTRAFSRWFSSLFGPTNNPYNLIVTNPTPLANAFFGGSTTNFTLTTLLNGYGTVTRSPLANAYVTNTVVSLTAVADAGYVFTGWNGDASGLANPTNVTMNTNKLVTASFAFITPPVITAQPQSLTVNRDSNAVFTVAATGPFLAYQWQHAGTNLPGATGTSFSIASAQKADGGNYSVVITNNYGSTTSSVAVLTVNLPYTWITLAGAAGQVGSTDGNGNIARFNQPIGVAVDNSNNVYVGDTYNFTVRKISSAGIVTTIAGSPGSMGSADGTGSAARFTQTTDLAVDSAGNIFVSDKGNHTIRKITPTGVATTFAGSAGAVGYNDATGSAARFNYPIGIAVDSSNYVYVSEQFYGSFGNTVRRISSAGVVTTLAGLPGAVGSADGTGSAARFNYPYSGTVDGANNFYVADSENRTIRKITPGGVVTTVAGSVGSAGSNDGMGTAARFGNPTGVASDSVGNLYVADSANHTIRKITSLGLVTTFAGLAGNSGVADGPANTVRFYQPEGVVVDTNGNIYVADYGNSTIRKGIPDYGQPIIYGQPQSQTVNRDSNTVLMVSATGVAGTAYQWLHAGTNLPGATGTSFNIASAQMAEGGNYSVVITNIYGSATSSIAVLTVNLPYTWITLAGLATNSGSADGIGSAARFNSPEGIAMDGSNNVYVADYSNHTIRKITPAGAVVTLAGLAGNSGSADGTGSGARLKFPLGLAVDAANNIYFAEDVDSTIRKVTPAGVVTTVAGLAGNQGNADGVGSAARFYNPSGVAADATGILFVSDRYNHTIRKVTPAGAVTTLAGLAGVSGSTDGAGGNARFNYPEGVALDTVSNVYVVDRFNSTIRKVSSDGIITTLAGLAGAAGSADGTGSTARFNLPLGLAADNAGNLIVGDYNSHTIRRVTTAGVVATIGGSAGINGAADGPANIARFNYPSELTVDNSGNVYVSDERNHTIRKGIPDYGQPIIYGQPTSVAVNRDSNAVLTVSATGVAGTAYQWLHAGTNLPGATGSSFNLASAQKADGGNYSVIITNIYGSATSAVAVLTVNLPYTWITLAGLAGQAGSVDGLGSSARLNGPYGIAIDGAGNLYASDAGAETIRKITPAGLVSTLAGLAGQSGGTDGIGSNARFRFPVGIAANSTGLVYVAEYRDNRVRVITPGGVVSTLANLGGQNGLIFAALDGGGNLHVADGAIHTIRKVTPSGVVSTVAGQAGNPGSNDGAVSVARFNSPSGVALDSSGNIFVSEYNNNTIRKVSSNGIVTTLAGLAGSAGTLDGSGSAARFNAPHGLGVGTDGYLFVSEALSSTIRRVTAAGVVDTIGGLAGNPGSADGAGSNARFTAGGVTVDAAGNIYLADTSNNTIRKGIPDYGQPIIYGQPQSQTVAAAASVTLGVTNTGALPLGYQWLLNGTNLNGATSSQFTIPSFQATNVGAYTVIITNGFGSATSSAALLNLPGVGNQPPAIVITSPTSNATFTAPVNVSSSVSATDDVQVASVVFLNGAAAFGTVTNAPFSFVWTNALVGTNALLAVATDSGGLSTTSAPVSVIVQTAVPQIVLTSPTNGASYTSPANILLSALASDADNSISNVAFFAGTNLIATQPTQPYNFTWSNVTAGSYALSAQVRDIYGPVVTSAPVVITVAAPNIPARFRLTPASQSVAEDAVTVAVTVVNDGTLGGTVNYACADVTATGSSGGGGDYTRIQGSLTFTNGEPSKTLFITIRDDSLPESSESFEFQLSNPGGGASLTNPSTATITIVDNDGGFATNSFLTIAFPTAVPNASGRLRVTLTPPEAGGQWRFPWELGWRNSGVLVTNLVPENYDVEIRAVSGYAAIPATVTIAVGATGITELTNQYFNTGPGGVGYLTVNVQPNTVGSNAGWRFIGEATYRTPGSTATNLVPGEQVIEFATVSGWSAPARRVVLISADQGTLVTGSYLVADPLPGGAQLPVPISPFSVINDSLTFSPLLPYAFNGQLQTANGFGSGVAVRDKVVLTAAHVVFDDVNLSYVNDVNWFFQKHAGDFDPKPQGARGWYVLASYSSARSNDLAGGYYAPGQSSPQSRNWDVAALYFTGNAARGGYGGYLTSDAATNEWLVSSRQKMLVGYPLDGAAFGYAGLSPGRMHATAALNYSFTQVSNRVYTTPGFLSFPGNSGGPVYVLNSNAYYPAGVYLGTLGNNLSLVRSIDSNVVALINLAANVVDDGTNFTGGGVVRWVAGGGNQFNPGLFRVNLFPSNAVTLGAGWRIFGGADTNWINDSNYYYSTNPGAITLEFRPIASYATLPNRAMNLTANQTTVIDATYLALPVLVVEPVGGLAAAGYAGGPFTPSGVSYALTNAGGTNLTWLASKAAAWLTLTPDNGTLIPGGSTNVVVTINASANSLAASNYADTVFFTNASSVLGSTSRAVTLTVNAPLPLVLQGPVQVGGGGLRLTLSGTPGRDYAIQFSTNLNSWTNIFTVTNLSGSYLFTNTPAGGLGKGFYRAQQLP